MTDACIVVVGQDGEQEAVNVGKPDEEEDFDEAAGIRDPFVPRYVVGQHLGDGGRSEANIHAGQAGQEKIQGRVEPGVSGDGQDDEQGS